MCLLKIFWPLVKNHSIQLLTKDSMWFDFLMIINLLLHTKYHSQMMARAHTTYTTHPRKLRGEDSHTSWSLSFSLSYTLQLSNFSGFYSAHKRLQIELICHFPIGFTLYSTVNYSNCLGYLKASLVSSNLFWKESGILRLNISYSTMGLS